jgi:hypothetical protein
LRELRVSENIGYRSPISSRDFFGGMGRPQRRNHEKGTLKPERERQLQKIEGWVWKVR